MNRIMEPLSSHGVPSVGYRGEWVMSDPAHWPGIASTTRPPLRVTRRSLIVSLYAILVPPHGLCLAPRKPPAWGTGGWIRWWAGYWIAWHSRPENLHRLSNQRG